MEQEFNVKLPDRPGELARVTGALRKGGVNIRTIATQPKAENVRIVTSNPNKTRQSLMHSGIQFSERNLLVARLKDRPGELARVSGALAGKGINIDAAYMLDKDPKHVHMALAVSDDEKGKGILDHLLYGLELRRIEKLIDKREKIREKYTKELDEIDSDTRKLIGQLAENPNIRIGGGNVKVEKAIEIAVKVQNRRTTPSNIANNIGVIVGYLKEAKERRKTVTELMKSAVKNIDDLIKKHSKNLA